MNYRDDLPLILIIDDLYGRSHADRRNRDRVSLCINYHLIDVTGDEAGNNTTIINEPIAQAVFHRGQKPRISRVGDVVKNDLDGVMEVIRKGWDDPHNPWAMVVLDLCFLTGRVTAESNAKQLGMPEGGNGDEIPDQFFGLQIMKAIGREFPDLPFIVLSNRSGEEISYEYTCLGAKDFLPRDGSSPEVLENRIWKYGLIPDKTGKIIGRSKPVLMMLSKARNAAHSMENVLIRGERGTGKGDLAKFILELSGRKHKSVNCGAISENLFESILFGHKPGAFTDAKGKRDGYIKAVDGGNLFLDEIGKMPIMIQGGILRTIQDREIQPLGSDEVQKVNVRFLIAANEDLEDLVKKEKFLPDLLDRLNDGIVIDIPPLKERKDDIPLLVEKFVREVEKRDGLRHHKIAPDLMDALRAQDWPGNIRQLESCIKKAVTSNPDVEHLVFQHLPSEIREHFAGKTVVVSMPLTAQYKSDSQDGKINADTLLTLLRNVEFDYSDVTSWAGKLGKLRRAWAEVEARYLVAALKVTKKPTAEYPDGKMNITAAIKLITGDKKLSTTDAIREVVRIGERVERDDDLLRKAYDDAIPRYQRRAKSANRAKSVNNQ
ncbi:MAG: Anaerobic nitric oxide reductase transcription regulator NorR [Gammaproteobacteria bacterium]|nr:Anaerobic nitric oxide reductase transcription regulator NorR [Gammaproteobacteria bacterium]